MKEKQNNSSGHIKRWHTNRILKIVDHAALALDFALLALGIALVLARVDIPREAMTPALIAFILLLIIWFFAHYSRGDARW
jgi:hypothetical protein